MQCSCFIVYIVLCLIIRCRDIFHLIQQFYNISLFTCLHSLYIFP